MIKTEELNDIFGQLTQIAETCLTISEFKEISKKYVREALKIHENLVKNNEDFFLELLLEIVDLLELSKPVDIPYIPFVTYSKEKSGKTYSIVFYPKTSALVGFLTNQSMNFN